MKKLFSYLLISSMVVLSSCTNYDDQFDDLNSQINSLKSQLDGFSSLSSGLTALQGTVAALQSAVAAIPTKQVDVSGLEASVAALQTSLASAATSAEAAAIQTQLTSAQTALAAAIESNATASTTNATSIAALQTSLEAVTATLAELKASLATASTTAEVAALTTSLAAVQANLTELLAQNNVYSTDVEINSAASLAVAKSLGNKLMILNADLIITQSTDMSAADLQAVVDKVTTITGNIHYTMSSKTSTNVNFNKLTSAAEIYMDVAGEISFPLLTNVKELHIDDSHLNYITGVSLPALTTITTFGTNSTATYSGGASSIVSATLNAINAPKATNIDLGALATYDAAVLTITGKLDHTLDLAALTSKKKDGSSIAPNLTINGAKTIDLPLLTKGNVKASTSKTIKLPLFIGNSTDNFSGAEAITLGAYTQTLITGAALKTIDFTGAKAENAKATDLGPTLTLDSSTAITSAVLGGVLNGVSVDFAAANTSLETLTLTGKANAVTVNNANGLTSLSLGHTAEQAILASLTVTENIGISSLSFDKLASAVSLTVKGNDALTTISADALATVGGTGAASIVVQDNDFTASQAELTKDADGTALAEGKFTSTSGMKDLQKYIDAGITRFATKGGTIYVAFDTLESYLNLDDVADTNAPYTWSDRNVNTKLEVAYVSDFNYTPKKTVSSGTTKAKRSFMIETGTVTSAFTLHANGSSILLATDLRGNTALAVNKIITDATTASATALGTTLSASVAASGTATVTFGALDATAENYPTTAEAIAQIANNNTFKVSDTATLNVDGLTVTASHTVGTGSNTTQLADALVALYNAKYAAGVRDYTLTAASGVITVASRDRGTGGVNNPISVVFGTRAASTSTTNVGYKINTVDPSDNTTEANRILVTFEAATAGSPLSEIGYPQKAQGTGDKTVQLTGTTSAITITELTTNVGGNAVGQSAAVTATNSWPTDSRADVKNPDGDVVTVTPASGTLYKHDQSSWL